jgi:hypothetical protein
VSSADWHLGSFGQTFKFRKIKKKSYGAGPDEYGVCSSAGVCQLETAGPKLLCAPMHCLGAKTKHNSTNIIFFSEPFLLILLQLERRIVDLPSSSLVHFQPR